MPHDDVLVDGDIRHQAETLLMTGRHHDGVALYRAAHEIRTLDGRARRAPADHATPLQHLLYFLLRARAVVGIGQPPLPPAGDPYRIRMPQRLNELLRIGLVPVCRVQHHAILHAEVLEECLFLFREVDLLFFGSSRYHHEFRVRAAGQLNEPGGDLRRQLPPAHDDQVAFLRAVGISRKRGGYKKEKNNDSEPHSRRDYHEIPSPLSNCHPEACLWPKDPTRVGTTCAAASFSATAFDHPKYR